MITIRPFIQHDRLVLRCRKRFVIPISPMVRSSTLVTVVLDVHDSFDNGVGETPAWGEVLGGFVMVKPG